MTDCIFCNIPDERIIDENDRAYVIKDGFPVTDGHSLIIPKRHVAEYFELSSYEITAIHELLVSTKEQLQSSDDAISGFNIGMNNGEDAGQTIFHCHIHLIPRRSGDVENPRGGVRGVIPGKQSY